MISLIALYNAITFKDKNFFSVVDEIMHNWQLLEKIIENNSKLFIDKYVGYSQNKTDYATVKNWVTSFVFSVVSNATIRHIEATALVISKHTTVCIVSNKKEYCSCKAIIDMVLRNIVI
jgi:hypothetical protein